MTRVAVNRTVLTWALERSGKTAVLQEKFPDIQRWQKGERQPTVRQLESLAKATFTPLGYFFLSKPPEDRLPIPHFRTAKDGPIFRPSPHLIEIVHTMERRQAWMREHLIEQGREQLPFVGSASLNDKPHSVAQMMREALGITEEWASKQPNWTGALVELRRRTERAGIIVVVSGIVGNNTQRKISPAEFRGFVLVDGYAPLIFVNGADAKAAQMFTLAHEIAHIWLGKSAAFDLRNMQPAEDKYEKACNEIAAEFLVPEDGLIKFWPSGSRESGRFAAVARYFKVSELVAARRALDLGLIEGREFFSFCKAYQESELRRASGQTEGGDFYATQNLRLGVSFASAVVRAAKEGKLSYREAFQLTGLYGKSFERYAKTLSPAASSW